MHAGLSADTVAAYSSERYLLSTFIIHASIQLPRLSLPLSSPSQRDSGEEVWSHNLDC